VTAQTGELTLVNEDNTGEITDTYALPVGQSLATDPITITYTQGAVTDKTTIIDTTAV
jgi:hypothetical protein